MLDAFSNRRIVMCSAGNGMPQGRPKPRRQVKIHLNLKGTQDAPKEADFPKGLLPRKRQRDPGSSLDLHDPKERSALR